MSRTALIGDLHFGEHRNSEEFNNRLINFINDFIERCRNNQVDDVIILGDVFHQRDQISNLTLNYAYKGIKTLSYYFPVTIIVGNHDMYYKNNRNINSLNVFQDISDVQIIKSIKQMGNLLMVPWICDEDDWNEVLNFSNKEEVTYIFGHFEFNGFEMNKSSICDNGYNPSTLFKTFPGLQKIYTGHFHVPQNQGGVEYIGSPFPHNFGDISNQHGFLILDLETGKENREFYRQVQYHIVDYQDYQNGKIEELQQEAENHDVYVRLDIHESLESHEIDKIRNELESSSFINSKIEYTPEEKKEILESEVEIEQIQNIDEQVIKYLKEIDLSNYEGYDNATLVQIYQEAMEE